MKIFFLIVFFAFSFARSEADTNLPACPADSPVETWHGCRGEHEVPDRRYSGEFSEGKYSGTGTLKLLVDGKVSREYSGTFRDGRPNGLVKLTTSDGQIYSGEMMDGQSHGQGIYTYTYEKKLVYRYEGTWKNGKMDGFGTLESYRFNSSYVGDWVEGKREGQGTFTWNKTGPFKNGKVVYVGGFKNNKRHGAGVQTAPITGKWPRKFVNSWIYQYTGTWDSGRVIGEGKATDDLGVKFEGNFAASGFGAANLLMTLPDGRKQYGFMSIDWQYEQLFGND